MSPVYKLGARRPAPASGGAGGGNLRDPVAINAPPGNTPHRNRRRPAAGGLTAYERFSLRPELFGYLLLTAELYVLCVGRRA